MERRSNLLEELQMATGKWNFISYQINTYLSLWSNWPKINLN